MLASEYAGNVDALIFRLLDTPYTAEWWDVTHALSRLGRFVVSDLIRVLQDGTAFAAAAAARILGDIGPDAAPAVPALLAQLAHPDSHVRSAAAHALAQINPRLKQSAPLLVERLIAEDDPLARRGLLRILAGTGRAAYDAVPHIAPALDDDSLFEDAVWALQGITGGELPDVTFLVERLRYPRSAVRCAAARALARSSGDAETIRAALAAAAAGSDCALEEEARAALRRLERRQKRPAAAGAHEDL